MELEMKRRKSNCPPYFLSPPPLWGRARACPGRDPGERGKEENPTVALGRAAGTATTVRFPLRP